MGMPFSFPALHLKSRWPMWNPFKNFVAIPDSRIAKGINTEGVLKNAHNYDRILYKEGGA